MPTVVSKNKPTVPFTETENGAVPNPGNATGKFLKDDATWAVPSGGGPPGATLDTYEWVLNGKISTTTQLGNLKAALNTGTITKAYLLRETPGTSGSTTIDIHLNGTTIWTTQSNRLVVTTGTNAIDTQTSFDTTAITVNDILTVAVDTAEVGNPLNLTVVLTVTPS